MKTSRIIYNPMSGRPGRRAQNVRAMQRLLDTRGIIAEADATAGPGDATRLAHQAVADQVELVIVYGGDGTVNEVIQGLAGSQTPLAIWPGGTSNVVARDLALPLDIGQLVEIFANGKTKRIALGRAMGVGRWESGTGQTAEAKPLIPNDQPPSRYFLMMAGIGLDASVARGVNMRLKRRTGELAYWLSGGKHLLTWQPEIFSLVIDGRSFESAFALIGNGKGYGGGMMMTPNAKLDESLFEVYVLPPLANNLSYLRALVACMRGKPETAGAMLVKGKLITANSSRQPWVEADGEIIGPLPMTFEIVPDALSVIVP
jgi:diacylglycerol kinase (ATP)